MAYAITDQWIMKSNGKTEHLQFRQGAITKIKSTTNKAKIVNSKSYEKSIEEIDKMLAELDELRELSKLPHDEQVKRLEEAEEEEDDLDSSELLRKRRLEEDEPDNQSTQESKYSVLDYHVGSVSGDQFLSKLKGNYKISQNGDKLMQKLGAKD